MRAGRLVTTVAWVLGSASALVLPNQPALRMTQRARSTPHMAATADEAQRSPFGNLRLPEGLSSQFTQLQSAFETVAGSQLRSQYAAAMATRIGFFLTVALENQRSVYNNTNLEPLTIVQTAMSVMLEGRRRTGDTEAATSAEAIEAQSVDNEFWREHFSMILNLLLTELEHVASGTYNLPYDLKPNGPASALQWNPLSVVQQSRRFLADQELIKARREAKLGQEVREAFEAGDRYPKYYLQNFHFQTDGWLSAKSAALYDFQVELLFLGMADAMRRQALPHVGEFLKGREVSQLKLLDVASGTGRFLSFVMDNHPSLQATASDLSPFYLAETKKSLNRVGARNAKYVEAAAENLPFGDEEFDLLTNVYLFHELPNPVRREVAAEMNRVLKTGGKLFFVDSTQLGRSKEIDLALQGFTTHSHEPYYADYCKDDLTALFQEAGFEVETVEDHWVSKLLVLKKVGATAAPEATLEAVEEAAVEGTVGEVVEEAVEEEAVEEEAVEPAVEEVAEEVVEEALEAAAEEEAVEEGEVASTEDP